MESHSIDSVIRGYVPYLQYMASSNRGNFMLLTNLPLPFAELLHSSFAFSTSGSTTLQYEEGIVSDNGPV